MTRRILKSGLLAAVTVFALLPAAGATATASTGVPNPVSIATAQYHFPPMRAGHKPAMHPRSHHNCKHHAHPAVHRVHRGKHHVHRTHRTLVPAGFHRSPALGRVATRHLALNVRSGPGTRYRVVGHRNHNRLVTVACKAYGGGVYGDHVWYRLAHRKGYVSARYVRIGAAVPWC